MFFPEALSTAGVMHLYLVDTISHGLQRELPGSIHCLAVISWPPAGTVNVNNLGHVADGWCLNDVSHEGLVQHPDTWKSDSLTPAGVMQVAAVKLLPKDKYVSY